MGVRGDGGWTWCVGDTVGGLRWGSVIDGPSFEGDLRSEIAVTPPPFGVLSFLCPSPKSNRSFSLITRRLYGSMLDLKQSTKGFFSLRGLMIISSPSRVDPYVGSSRIPLFFSCKGKAVGEGREVRPTSLEGGREAQRPRRC